MKLYIKERIILLGILPQKAVTYQTYQAKRSFVKQIALTDEEKEQFEITQDEQTGAISWNPETDRQHPKEIAMSDTLARYLKDMCEEVSEKEFAEEVWEVVERVFDEASAYIKE